VDISDLQSKVERVRNYPALVKELQAQYGKMPFDEYVRKAQSISASEQFDLNGKRIRIKYAANHYYVPLILSDEEKIEHIKHIIKTPSEVKFINDLEKYLAGDNKFKEFHWWLFSKLDESLDEVYIPYYNPKSNGIRDFKPDFIFWLQKGSDYFIVFVDPKGTEHTDYERKIDGYRSLFEEDGGSRVIEHEGMKVRVSILLYTGDEGMVSERYRKYWCDSIDRVLNRVLERPDESGTQSDACW
jgi:hypothetical protein